ncbi:glycosyltransferase [Xanthomonas campestris]|uniref:glycosyltransferase n=1 Tax=Xanthomonas campestris TaxID=339 RepID=UPI003CEF5DE1
MTMQAAVQYATDAWPGTDEASFEVRLAVVIPCYRVRTKVLDVLASIPAQVERIYVVDDHCPDASGTWVEEGCADPRVVVCRNPFNLGVGGATITGYRAAVADGMEIIVKMDGDGQMDPDALPELIGPIVRGEADYTKGNRFYDLAQIGRMPKMRIIGNAALSFLTKLSSGYWDIFDPTNGYTAVHASVVARMPLDKISRRYFFESDMLFRLNTIRAVVVDVPMDARYGDEVSNLSVRKIVLDFAIRHLRNFGKRIFYNYFLRDLSLASLELVAGVLFLFSGATTGVFFWLQSAQTGYFSSAGSVMLAALQVIVGIQLILGFLAYDIAAVPARTLHLLVNRKSGEGRRG